MRDPAIPPQYVSCVTSLELYDRSKVHEEYTLKILKNGRLDALVVEGVYNQHSNEEFNVYAHIPVTLRTLQFECCAIDTVIADGAATTPNLEFMTRLTRLEELALFITTGPDTRDKEITITLPNSLKHLMIGARSVDCTVNIITDASNLEFLTITPGVRFTDQCRLPIGLVEIFDLTTDFVTKPHIPYLTRLAKLSCNHRAAAIGDLPDWARSLPTLDIELGDMLEGVPCDEIKARGTPITVPMTPTGTPAIPVPHAYGIIRPPSPRGTPSEGKLGLTSVRVCAVIPRRTLSDGTKTIDMRETYREDGKLCYSPSAWNCKDDDDTMYMQLLQQLVDGNADTLESLSYTCCENSTTLDLSKARHLLRLGIYRDDSFSQDEPTRLNIGEQIAVLAEFGKLTKLCIDNLDIPLTVNDRPIADIIYSITTLERLDILQCAIGEITHNITKLQHLQCLSLTGSRVVSIHPNIGYMTTLRQLRLPMAGCIIPYSICRLTHLLEDFTATHIIENAQYVHDGIIPLAALFANVNTKRLGYSLEQALAVVERGPCATGYCYCVDHFLDRVGTGTRLDHLPRDIIAMICERCVQRYGRRNIFPDCICDNSVDRDTMLSRNKAIRYAESRIVLIESNEIAPVDPVTGELDYPPGICHDCGGDLSVKRKGPLNPFQAFGIDPSLMPPGIGADDIGALMMGAMLPPGFGETDIDPAIMEALVGAEHAPPTLKVAKGKKPAKSASAKLVKSTSAKPVSAKPTKPVSAKSVSVKPAKQTSPFVMKSVSVEPSTSAKPKGDKPTRPMPVLPKRAAKQPPAPKKAADAANPDA